MTWNKGVYFINLHGGEGSLETSPMYGLVRHLMIIPDSLDTVWSIQIKDAEGDIVYDLRDHYGRLDDKEGLPVGREKQQPLNVRIYDTTKNERVSLIFKVEEIK